MKRFVEISLSSRPIKIKLIENSKGIILLLVLQYEHYSVWISLLVLQFAHYYVWISLLILQFAHYNSVWISLLVLQFAHYSVWISLIVLQFAHYSVWISLLVLQYAHYSVCFEAVEQYFIHKLCNVLSLSPEAEPGQVQRCPLPPVWFSFFLGGGGCKFWLHDTHIYNYTLIAVNMQCSQNVLYFLLSLQNLGVFLRDTLQSQRPKYFTVPWPRPPVLQFLDPPLETHGEK